MLADSIFHWDDVALGPVWQSVRQELKAFLEQGDALDEGSWTLPCGCSVSVSRYETRPESQVPYEAHMVMADVQIMLSGEEYLDVHTVGGLAEAQAYDPERDIVFFHASEAPLARVHLRPGSFVLLRPHDAHRPGMAVGRPGPVMKMVVKIPDAWLDLSPEHMAR